MSDRVAAARIGSLSFPASEGIELWLALVLAGPQATALPVLELRNRDGVMAAVSVHRGGPVGEWTPASGDRWLLGMFETDLVDIEATTGDAAPVAFQLFRETCWPVFAVGRTRHSGPLTIVLRSDEGEVTHHLPPVEGSNADQQGSDQTGP